ncbi:MAG TPA: hypothetical protein VGI64_06475 [Streptosporangiaceae bacterium]|jgi:hypothetical protein
MPAARFALHVGGISLAAAFLFSGPAAAASPAVAAASAGTAAAAASAETAATGSARSAGPAVHHGIVPPKHPRRNVQPRPNFLQSASCIGGKDGPGCNTMARKAITRGRRILERMRGMSFSMAAYEKLTPVEQLFVTVNLERTSRGLAPAAVLVRRLNRAAQAGANQVRDPVFRLGAQPGGWTAISFGGNWAGGYDNALGSDFGWMYDDGLGSPNLDCTKAHRAGCWGHRDNILGTYATPRLCGGRRHELAMGAGHVRRSKKIHADSETELFVGVCGPQPTGVVLSWARARKLIHAGG